MHSHEVTCLRISNCGTRLASGQCNIAGVKADTFIWDFTQAKVLCDAGKTLIGKECVVHRLKQHTTKVQSVAFSENGEYLSTMGGMDDNAIVVWNVKTGVAICGSPAGPDAALCMQWMKGRNDRFVSAGAYHLRVWQIDFSLPKLHAIEAKMGTVRRVVTCITLSEDDAIAYCGTETGDVLMVRVDRDELRSFNDPDTKIPSLLSVSKDRISLGVLCIQCITNPKSGNQNLLLGGGDGTFAYMNPQLKLVPKKSVSLLGGVSGFTLHPSGGKVLVGTLQCNQYELSMDLVDQKMVSSCHFGPINDVAFPEGCPDLVVTSSTGDIRIWNTSTSQELLRIQVPNLECSGCVITPTGSTIVSGWNDGKVRAFYPETGRLKFVIPDAHTDNVTAIAVVDNDARSPWRLITGGAEGRVRVWNVTSSHRAMVASTKEHRGPINCIKVNKDSTQAITASSDGSCIVWDLERYVRLLAFYEPNMFLSVLYHPDESQLLTCGSNHKITYWDASDGQAIRVIDGGDHTMTSLDVEPDGEFFATGSDDKTISIWHYDDGIPIAMGRGHSGKVKSVKISPDRSTIVSVGSSGEMIFWEMPTVRELRSVIDEH
jgi:cilia- and flagella-associated protein 52